MLNNVGLSFCFKVRYKVFFSKLIAGNFFEFKNTLQLFGKYFEKMQLDNRIRSHNKFDWLGKSFSSWCNKLVMC